MSTRKERGRLKGGKAMRIFAVGDVVSDGGLRALEKLLPPFKRLKGIGFTVVNGENAAGMGILPEHAARIYNAGADVITLGNHAFARKETLEYAEDDRTLLRPANMTHLNPGRGYGVFEASNGVRIGIFCLMGRIFTEASLESPFFTADRILKEMQAPIVLAEIHGDATSEKAAVGRYLDGRVSAVFGTHTHVQTADERIFPGGTGFITDLGMTGPIDSILGMDVKCSIDRLLGAPQIRYKAATGPCELRGALFDIDENSGKCRAVERIAIT